MDNRRHKIREVVQKIRHLLNRKFRKDRTEKRLLKKIKQEHESISEGPIKYLKN